MEFAFCTFRTLGNQHSAIYTFTFVQGLILENINDSRKSIIQLFHFGSELLEFNSGFSGAHKGDAFQPICRS